MIPTARTKLRSAPTPPSSLLLFSNGIPNSPHKMPPRKSLLKPTLTLASLLSLSLFALYFASLSPFFTPSASNPRNFLLGSPGKVRIYMYDLPRKFTYGVIETYAKARGGADPARPNNDALLKYPGNQHSAEWHLFRDLNRPGNERVDSAVTRVYDPEEADLFYVPFFSSISLVVNMNRPGAVGEPVLYSDEEMQESLLEWLDKQVYWKRNNGWDHVFVCQDPNALYKIVDRVKNGILLVSDFGRLTHEQGSLVKDVILPYSHRINPYVGEIGIVNRDKLLFFMGNRYRKEGGKVRDLLFQLLEKEVDVMIKHGAQSRESRREATKGMHTSKFCLHPAGDTPSACRLFDAIVSLCVPVVVSDYVELPFEDVIDYRKIAIFVDTNSAVKPGFLVNLLRKVRTDQILEFQQNMNKVKHYFEYEDPNGTVKEIWRQVSQKLPLVKLMINRDKRLVSRELTEPDCSCLCSNQSGIHTIQHCNLHCILLMTKIVAIVPSYRPPEVPPFMGYVGG